MSLKGRLCLRETLHLGDALRGGDLVWLHSAFPRVPPKLHPGVCCWFTHALVAFLENAVVFKAVV